MISTKRIFFLILIAATQTVAAQFNLKDLFSRDREWNSGYQKAISGEEISYFSAFPEYADRALLTRATDGTKVIAWETAPITHINKDGFAYIRWIAGHSSGTNSADRHFDFYINGSKALTITTTKGDQNANWSFENATGVRLWFEKLKNDHSNDAHGIAYLRIPVNQIKVGEPLKLKIIGAAEHSNDWLMTFKFDFKEHASVSLDPVLLKNGKRPVNLRVLHFGRPEKLKVVLGGRETFNFDLVEESNAFEIPITTLAKADSILIRISAGKEILFDGKVWVRPLIDREIHFLHHSHTDIGYSHLQSEVAQIHIKNIRDALLMIDKTKSYPKESQFKWNIESLWAVENFLNVASSAEKESFFKAVKEGSIGLSAMYANMLTGLSMPEELFEYTAYAQFLKKTYQIPINSAMVSDVPGLAWGTVTALAKGGVKYVSSGPNYMPNNPYLGDRVGHFVKEWADQPVWWASPSSTEKVLLWVAGKGYSSWHGNKAGAISTNGFQKIVAYLNELEQAQYPYKMVQWRYNILADNAPIDSTISDFVRNWNEKYASPKLVLSTTSQLFEQFEAENGSKLKTVSGDLTPYWEDGAASSAAEEGMTRVNSLKIQQLNTLYAILAPQRYPKAKIDTAWKNLLLFHEHTWGAHNSISAPEDPFVKEQWRIKSQFAKHGDEISKQVEKDLTAPILNNSYSKFAVVNTLSWNRGGLVYLPAHVQANSVVDENGKSYPTQKLKDGRSVFYAAHLNPMSVTLFTPQLTRIENKTQLGIEGDNMSNGLLSLTLDPKNGSIISLENIEGYSFTKIHQNQGLNGYWFVDGKHPEQGKTSTALVRKIEESGPILTQVTFTGTVAGSHKLIKRITLLAGEDRFYIENSVDKIKATGKEAVYFSFPFANGMDRASVDAGYGTISYGGKTQLEGSNKDFIPTKRWLDLSDQHKGVQLIMNEAFMASPRLVDETPQVGGYKKWQDSTYSGSTWFVYAMNNYWHTNYKASQEGIANFNFVVRPHGKLKQLDQEKAAMEFAQPLVVFGTTEQGQFSKGLLQPTNNQVIITNIIPQEGGGYLLRLLNPNDSNQQTQIAFGSYRPQYLKNVATQQQMPLNASFQLQPLQLIEVLVK